MVSGCISTSESPTQTHSPCDATPPEPPNDGVPDVMLFNEMDSEQTVSVTVIDLNANCRTFSQTTKIPANNSPGVKFDNPVWRPVDHRLVVKVENGPTETYEWTDVDDESATNAYGFHVTITADKIRFQQVAN